MKDQLLYEFDSYSCHVKVWWSERYRTRYTTEHPLR